MFPFFFVNQTKSTTGTHEFELTCIFYFFIFKKYIMTYMAMSRYQALFSRKLAKFLTSFIIIVIVADGIVVRRNV